MELPQIKAFIDAMASSDLTELEVSKDGWTLRLVRGVGLRTAERRLADPAPHRQSPHRQSPRHHAAPETAAAPPEICAPLSGVVYLGPSPNQPPFVAVGQAITAGTPVCVIEAMKTFNEIRAERDGIVEAILVASETLVDAGQPLIRIT
jgi:acetyl-CoA carboxylase biotin carboxyl carrier protein